MEYILYATVAALLDCDNVSLLGIQRMLSDGRYRAWVVRQIKDPMVRSFWVNEFEDYESVAFCMKRLRRFKTRSGNCSCRRICETSWDRCAAGLTPAS